jgi:hypothetical protein
LNVFGYGKIDALHLAIAVLDDILNAVQSQAEQPIASSPQP